MRSPYPGVLHTCRRRLTTPVYTSASDKTSIGEYSYDVASDKIAKVSGDVVGCDNLKIFPYFGGKSRAIFGDNDSPSGVFNSRSSQRPAACCVLHCSRHQTYTDCYQAATALHIVDSITSTP